MKQAPMGQRNMSAVCPKCRRKASAARWRAFYERAKQTIGPVGEIPSGFFASGQARMMRRAAEKANDCQFVFRYENKVLVLVPYAKTRRVERLRWKPERLRKGFAW